MSKPTPPPVSSDRPIRVESEDMLGRSGFARDLARLILSWGGEESVVLAVNGEWGSGKSSFINLLLRSLKRSSSYKKGRLAIVQFNPWSFSSNGDINTRFFDRLATKIDGRSKKSYKRIRKMAKLMRDLPSVADGVLPDYQLTTWFSGGIMGLLLGLHLAITTSTIFYPSLFFLASVMLLVIAFKYNRVSHIGSPIGIKEKIKSEIKVKKPQVTRSRG